MKYFIGKPRTNMIIFLAVFVCLIFAFFIYQMAISEKEHFNVGNLSIPTNGVIPQGYYKVDDKNMAVIPYGNAANVGTTGYHPITNAQRWEENANQQAIGSAGPTPDKNIFARQYSNSPDNAANPTINYNPDTVKDSGYKYHDDPSKLTDQADDSEGLGTNGMWVIDQTGKKVWIPKAKVQGDITYYQPGSYRFGPSSYVPTYEDSIYLSTTSDTTISDSARYASYDSPNLKGGICSYNKNSPDKLEDACLALDKNTCASTTCCVLLGGSKCVSGKESGPIMKANYSDRFIVNRDYYYYQGKCYGNCPNS